MYTNKHILEKGPVVLFDNLLCKGNEGNLTQCPNDVALYYVDLKW